MRASGLIKRNVIEILRDPLTLALGAGLPAFLLILFTVINASVDAPLEIFAITPLVPGVAVFGYSMLMMLCATLIAVDRQTSFFTRLQTLPLSATDFIVGYCLPFIPIALVQTLISYVIGLILGMAFTWQMFLSILVLLPVAVVFIAIGVMMGVSMPTPQITAIGNAIVMVVVVLSGAWIPLDLIGGALKTAAYVLPFAHAVNGARELIIKGSVFDWWHLAYILGYAVVTSVLAILVFAKKLKNK